MRFKKNNIIILSIILFNFLLSAAAASAASDTEIQNAILVHINEYRQKHGLSKLTMNNNMVREAQRHSMNMANHRIPFGHKDFPKRISTLHSQIKNSGAGAENVAYNYKDARTVVEQWILSPGHKRNIVGNYNITGIGIARDKQGKIYFTQLFLRTNEPNSRTHTRRYVSVPFFGVGYKRSA